MPTRKDGKKKRNHTFIQVRNSTTRRMTKMTTREVMSFANTCANCLHVPTLADYELVKQRMLQA